MKMHLRSLLFIDRTGFVSIYKGQYKTEIIIDDYVLADA
jgi:hypothetical protein